MRQVIFSKTSSTGQQIEVRAAAVGVCSLAAQLFIDGKFCSGPAAPQKLQAPKGEVTHFMGGKSGAAGFTAAEAAQIQDAFDAAQKLQLETPDAQAFLAADKARVDGLIRADAARAAMPSTRLMRDMDRADSNL